MPTRSIPWPRILAEGVAIVVSILLAFGIQAWWEGREDDLAEVEYLSAILDEIDPNLVGLDGNINVAEGRGTALRRASRRIDQNLHADSAEAFVTNIVLDHADPVLPEWQRQFLMNCPVPAESW